MHQVGVVGQGGRFQTGEDSFGSTVLYRGLIHDPDGFLATAPGLRMRPENHRVAGLDGHDALEEHSGRRVGDGGQREDEPDRFSHLHNAAIRKLANDANGGFVANVVVDKFCGHHVLEGLVFKNAEPGFLNRQAGEVLGLFQSGKDNRFDNAIDVHLSELREDGGGSFALTDQSFEVSDAVFTEA